MADITLSELIERPDFLGLPATEKRKALSRVSPQFRGLSAVEQSRFIRRLTPPSATESFGFGLASQGPRSVAALLESIPGVGPLAEPFGLSQPTQQEREQDQRIELNPNARRSAAAGAGVFEALPLLPLGVAGLAPRAAAGAALTEIASGAAGEAVRSEAEARGKGSFGQFAASLAGGVGVSSLPRAGRAGLRAFARSRGRQTLQERLVQAVPEDAVEAGLGNRANLRSQVRQAYKGVGDVDGLDTSSLGDIVTQLRADFDPDSLPLATLRRVEREFSDTVNLRKLVNFEQSIGQRIKVASRKGKDQTAAALARLREGVSSVLDSVSVTAGPDAESIRALQKAKSLRRLQGEVFDNSPRIRAFFEDADINRAFGAIVRSRDKRDLDRLVAAVGDDGADGLRVLMRDHVFGPDLEAFARGPRSAIRALQNRRVRAAYDRLFEEGAADGALAVSKQLQRLPNGDFGSIDETMLTAWNAVRSGRWGEAGQTFLRVIGFGQPTREQGIEFMQEALFNPKYAKGILGELPTELAQSWRREVATQFTRAAFGVVGQEG